MAKTKEKQVKLKKPSEYTEEEVEGVRKLQKAFIVKKAREHLKRLVRQNYVKLYDKALDAYVYKNRTTGDVQQQKPVFLGKEDLPTPKNYAMPIDYIPMDKQSVEGYSLVISCPEFQSEKLPEIGASVLGDHKEVVDLLTHDLICMIPSENQIELLNPTLDAVNEALDDLRRNVRADGFLVVYIHTHVATVWSGEKEQVSNQSGMGHFLLHDTVWRDAKKVAATSLSVNQLIHALNGVFCKRKVVILNHAHDAYKSPSVFGSKVLYPPSYYMQDLAAGAKCAVLGSCSVGSTLKSSIDLSPPLWEQLRTNHRPIKPERPLDNEEEVATGPSLTREAEEEEKARKDELATLLKKRRKGLWKRLFGRKVTAESLGDFPNDDEFEEWQEEQRIAAIMASGVDPEAHLHTYNELCHKLRAEMKMPALRDLSATPPPPPLAPTWKPREREAANDATEEEGGQYDCEMPTLEEYEKYDSDLKWWAAKESVMRPFNGANSAVRSQTLRYSATSRQVSHVSTSTHTNSSLFGRAFVQALRGGASSESKLLVSVRDIFEHIRPIMAREASEEEKVMQEEAHERHKQLAKELKAGKNPKLKQKDVDKAGLPVVFTQTPVLFLPPGREGLAAADFPVCFCCGPPASPERPFAVRVRLNEVTLQWIDPIFDGVEPTNYEIIMRSTSRNFSDWNEVPNKVPIPGKTFTIKNLPSGLPVEFKVRAFNPGGWSTLSDMSQRAIPGVELTPPSTEERWRRITEGGPLAAVDMLKWYPGNRLEHLLGFQRLICEGQKKQGFKKEYQLKIAEVAMRAVHTFEGDVDIIYMALLVVGYTLMTKNKKAIRVYVIKEGLPELVQGLLTTHRDSPKIIGALAWLRSKLPEKVPPNPIIVYDTKKEEEESEEFLAAKEELEETDAALIRALAKVII